MVQKIKNVYHVYWHIGTFAQKQQANIVYPATLMPMPFENRPAGLRVIRQ